jgi:hypothetical protein
MARVCERAGITPAALFYAPRRQQERPRIVKVYPYTDARDRLLFEVVRLEPKDFRQRRPDGRGGYIWNLDGIQPVLYRLPEVIDAVQEQRTVYLVEGEKDVEMVRMLGLTSSCNAMGAKKWRDSYTETLCGANVAILPDNDKQGREHAALVACSLHSVAASVKVVTLPNLPDKGDVSDWVHAGGTREELETLVAAAQPWRPPVQGATGLPLTSLRDLLQEPEDAVEWLVKGLLPESGLSLLVAKPKVGKSTLARNLALAVSQGQDFFGRTVQYGPVIYLALEEKRSEVRKHFRDMGVTGKEPISVYVASAPVDGLQQVRQAAEQLKPVLIIIDPLFRFTRVKDGNDYAQMTQALEPLLVLARETRAHVLCVHHAGKTSREDGDSILGSSAIRAAVDTSLFLKKTERYRTISSEQRYGEALEETVLHFNAATRTVTLGASKEREETALMKTAILEWLRGQEEGSPEAVIKDSVEGNNRHKQTALRELVADGQVIREGQGTRGAPFLYKLTFSLAHLPPMVKSVSEKPEMAPAPHGSKENSHFGISALSAEAGSENPPQEEVF